MIVNNATSRPAHEVREVARQVAVRSVVKSFGMLSFDQQKEALVQLQAAHDQSRAEKRAELEQMLADLGYRAPKK